MNGKEREAADEILRYQSYNIEPLDTKRVVSYEDAIECMLEFAEKMARENLREELINWADYWNRIETGHACIMKEDIDEYLKSKEQ